MSISNIVEIAAIGMFFIGFFGLITSANIIKSVVYLTLLESGVIMFFLSVGVSAGMLPPIAEYLYQQGNHADPLPSALMITAIVIGLSVTSINITMLMTLLRKYRTASWTEVSKAVREENHQLLIADIDDGEDQPC